MSYGASPPPPPGGGVYSVPGEAEHPEGQNLLIISIVALLCCAPVNIWILIRSNQLLGIRTTYNMSKVSTARTIAIISLVLWALLVVFNLGTLAMLFSAG